MPLPDRLGLLIVPALVLLASACADGNAEGGRSDVASDAPDALEGTVLYRERMAPPPNAVLTIRLEDVSRADAPSEVIAEQTRSAEGGPPWTFRLDYDGRRIQAGHRYTVRARIEADGRLLWTSTEHVPPFDRPDGEPIEIVLSRTGGGDTP